jgi:hypothetical protein
MHITPRAAAALLAPALLASGLVVAASPAQAARAPVKSFKNCTAMHKVYAYRGGVRKPHAVDHRSSGHAQYTPYVGLKRYRLNSSLDRDKDGVACEA